MSAIEERAAGSTGKSTQSGGRPSVGEATRTLTLPQAPYGDAVHAALAAAGLVPDVMEAGLRSNGPRRLELFLRMVWLPGHPGLADVQHDEGLTVAWSHLAGWSGWVGGYEPVLLDVNELAAPELVADAAEHLAAHGTHRAWVPPADGRWSDAVYLDIALGRFEEREVNR
ncbi:hypothetical protein ADL35_12440 [Streptomyces sp. NRRL WC-3753]|nr:hypothetical protein ADL35_12440 [Streptomyces sp. NRRL WC-3753]